MVRPVRVWLVLSLAISACSDPRVTEDLAAACANEMDDDGDGLVDCADPDCAGTKACERTTETCSNDIDDDRDGTLDCRQASCRELAICKEPERRDCRLAPTASEMGCPRGKGCYVTPDNTRWCALEGTGLAGDACGADPNDRSQGCAAAHLCNERRRCARICTDDYHCTRNSICPVTDAQVRLCTASCLPPAVGCDASEECVAYQRRDVPLERGGWAHECAAAGRFPPGTADLAMPCRDAEPGRSASETCRPGLLCIPSPDGPRCRTVCRGRRDGRASADVCEPGTRCWAVVPFSGQSERFDESYAIGVCLPP